MRRSTADRQGLRPSLGAFALWFVLGVLLLYLSFVIKHLYEVGVAEQSGHPVRRIGHTWLSTNNLKMSENGVPSKVELDVAKATMKKKRSPSEWRVIEGMVARMDNLGLAEEDHFNFMDDSGSVNAMVVRKKRGEEVRSEG